MLLLVSSLILSQNTNTGNIPASQIPEIYKGLKQNEYLKVKLQKTEAALSSASNLISEQEKAIAVSKTMIKSKDEIIGTIQGVAKQDQAAADERENQLKSDITMLRSDIEIMELINKNDQKKKFWGGVRTGIIGTVVAAAIAILVVSNN
jgi:hypothetical protein